MPRVVYIYQFVMSLMQHFNTFPAAKPSMARKTNTNTQTAVV